MIKVETEWAETQNDKEELMSQTRDQSAGLKFVKKLRALQLQKWRLPQNMTDIR